jgi:hypothetical protein
LNSAERWGAASAWTLAAAIPLSGPVGFGIVNAVSPAPAWSGAENFARHFHPVQVLPYLFGFLLVGSSLILMASIYRVASGKTKTQALAGLAFTVIFASLIGFNYILQSVFVPALVRAYEPAWNTIISAFSMANPSSLAWALEMWGYAFLGMATLLVAPVFSGGTLEKWTGSLLVANGILSLLGAVLTLASMDWLLRPAGYWSYLLWNAVVLAMALCLAACFRQRMGRFADSHAERLHS